jgi:2-oxoglutarate ferredoxin oxidoreductase subunit delta
MSTTSTAPTSAKEAKPKPTWNRSRCKRCGICSHFCPVNAIETNADGVPTLAHPELCTSCHLCERMCPDFAITLVSPTTPPGDSPASEAAEPEHPEPAPQVCHVFDACEE